MVRRQGADDDRPPEARTFARPGHIIATLQRLAPGCCQPTEVSFAFTQKLRVLCAETTAATHRSPAGICDRMRML